MVYLHAEKDFWVTSQLLALARGLDCCVCCHKGYIINSFRFCTKESEKNFKTQNNGVIVKGDEFSGNLEYYGVIQKIYEIGYVRRNLVILFKCDWFEIPLQGRSQSRGYKKDAYGFVSIDVTRLHCKNDPFVLATQVESVYYV